MGEGTIGGMTPPPQSNRSSSQSPSASRPRGNGLPLGTVDRTDCNPESQWDNAPNPFSRVLTASEPSAKDRFVRAVRTLVVTLALTAILFAGAFFGKQFLLAQLVAGFDDLDAAGKQARLTQIASFGLDAVEPLAGKLANEEDAVSVAAFTLLQQLQNDWITLSPAAAQAAHNRLIESIATAFRRPSKQAGIPGPAQRGRASELLRQSILEFSSAPSQTPELLGAANDLLAELDGPASTNAMLANSPVQLRSAPRRHSVAKVARLATPVRQSGWTDWPPPTSTQTAQIVRSGARRASVEQANLADQADVSATLTAPASLQALPRGVMAPLQQITSHEPVASSSPAVAAHRPVSRVIQVSADADAPIETLSESGTMEKVSNSSDAANERGYPELTARGFSKSQLEPAAKWSNAAAEERIAMVSSLARSGELGTEPWLSYAINDPDRRVRLEVVGALEKSHGAAVSTSLRKLLAGETDPHVAARIRRILDLF